MYMNVKMYVNICVYKWVNIYVYLGVAFDAYMHEHMWFNNMLFKCFTHLNSLIEV